MEQTNGKVLAVIPNYNGGEYVLRCLQSLLDQTYRPIETVVIDNASTDGSDQLIQKRFPQIRLIQTGSNSGWGVACNIGMKSSASEYIALINNDAYLDPGCVWEMVRVIQKNPKYGSAASRILLADQPDTTEVAGLVIYRDGSSCGRGRLKPAGTYGTEEEVFCANDCCSLYRRAMIEDIGDYDPDFFIYCDETDIGWKHQLAGWKCVYAPDAIAYHVHSRSAGSYSDFKAFHVERNRIFIAIKYFPFWNLLMSIPYSIARYWTQWYVAAVEKKGALAQYKKTHSIWAGIWILAKAHGAALVKFPVMWKRRQELKRIKRISNSDIEALFHRFGISTRAMASYE